jgi:hypothetical protein
MTRDGINVACKLCRDDRNYQHTNQQFHIMLRQAKQYQKTRSMLTALGKRIHERWAEINSHDAMNNAICEAVKEIYGADAYMDVLDRATVIVRGFKSRERNAKIYNTARKNNNVGGNGGQAEIKGANSTSPEEAACVVPDISSKV